jgi:hypothetical protein
MVNERIEKLSLILDNNKKTEMTKEEIFKRGGFTPSQIKWVENSNLDIFKIDSNFNINCYSLHNCNNCINCYNCKDCDSCTSCTLSLNCDYCNRCDEVFDSFLSSNCSEGKYLKETDKRN